MSVRKARDFRTLKHTEEAHHCEYQPTEKIGFCITDFSRTISIDILSRLPLACVFWCRCVCKTWRNLTKDSEFAKLHFSRAEAYPLIRAVGPTHMSRTLYFIDQPPKSDPCYDSSDDYFKPKVIMKLDTKLKIPLNNAELAITEGEPVHSKRKRVTKLRREDHKLKVVNSCNGFLCLSELLHNNPVMVCNPVTGEFVKLPPPTQTEWESSTEHIDCGLGFCPKTNQYKVIRMFKPEIREPEISFREYIIEPITGRPREFVRMAEIHTLGTNTWEMLSYAPAPFYKLGFCTYLNGLLHWLYLSFDEFCRSTYLIAAFDFSKEIFESIARPPDHNRNMYIDQNRISIGQLRGCLCVCDTSDDCMFGMKLWVMKTYGDESSWTLEFTINLLTRERWLYGLYEPMSYFKDGTVLFFHPVSNSVFSYHPKIGFLKFLKVRGVKSKFEAISYIPSLYSLKDAIKEDGMEVYNIKSRCGGLKLQGESNTISLVEENVTMASDFDLSDTEVNRRDKPWWLK